MADPEDLARLRHGIEEWNLWRRTNLGSRYPNYLFLANSKYSLSRAIFMLLTFRMRDFIVLIVHLASTIFRIGRAAYVP